MKKLITQIAILFISIMFVGCELNKDYDSIPSVGDRVKIPVQTETIVSVPPKLRYDLKKVQTFFDSDAYNNVRNVYILVDNETGKEYLGISGIGITEMGKHTQTKSTVTDER